MKCRITHGKEGRTLIDPIARLSRPLSMATIARAGLLPCLIFSGSAQVTQNPNHTAMPNSRIDVTVEDAGTRRRLPLYKVIPAAKDSELTSATTINAASKNWSRSNGDAGNTRYSMLTQINRSNVGQLKVAWVYHSKDGTGNIQANPIIVDGVMFAPTVGKDIVAVDAATGVEIWRYRLASGAAVGGNSAETRSQSSRQTTPSDSADMVGRGFGPAKRGLTYWSGDTNHKPRLYFLTNGYLIALDAKTGRRVESFGDHGTAAASKGPGTSFFLGSVAPAIYKNVIVAPNQNIVDAYDVVTGARLWQYNTLQYPVKDPAIDNGGNVWGGIAMDLTRGIVFVECGDPHPNFVGIDRPGDNPGTSSLVALDASTGKKLWEFQEVAHNLWDLDNPSPPNLVTVMHNGRRVDAVAQVTKLGNTLLLDRVSGKPLFPFRLRRAPVSTVPGETTAAYQPDLEKPEPFARQVFTADDVTNISPQSHAFILDEVQHATSGWFEPAQIDKQIIFYGVHGGAEWTGASFDPSTGWLYVSANELAWVESLSAAKETPQSNVTTPGRVVYQNHCAMCHGENRQGQGMVPSLVGVSERYTETQVSNIIRTGKDAMPPVTIADNEKQDLLRFLFGHDIVPGSALPEKVTYHASGFTKLLDKDDYPGNKPPWGTLNAIDLNTGKLAWKVPLGDYDALTRKGVPQTGTENFGGAMSTAGGLVFCAGTRDLKIRAFDKASGKELWQAKLPYGGYAPPATYAVNGRQYVVIAATGGGKLGGDTGDAYVAFALPRNKSKSKH
jgi:quinoprotein glucose dehydrogenase